MTGPERISPTSRNADRLRTLTEVSQVLSATLDLHVLYETIHQQVGRVMATDTFLLALHRQQRGTTELAYVWEDGKLYRDVEVPHGPSLITHIIQGGIQLLLDTDADYRDYTRAHGLPQLSMGEKDTESMLFVPLTTHSRTIGALSVQTSRPHAYTPEDIQILSVIATQAAIAIENARLFAAQQQRVYELDAIQSIVQKLTPLHDLPAIAAVIHEELMRLIDYHSCRLFVLDPRDNSLTPFAGSSLHPEELRLPVGESSITGAIAASGRPELIPDTLLDPRASQIAGTPRRSESLIGAPLVAEGRVQGVITLSKLGPNQFDENDLRLLEIIAAQCALALDRARLYRELRIQATTDELTGLYNRRYLLDRLREEQARARRNGHPLAALMLDIDRFKAVNDRFGHDAGDVVLRELARIVRNVVRTEDVVARYGGEEFCVLLPEIEWDGAEQVAERLRLMIERRLLPQEAGVARITVSLGLAFLQGEDDGAELVSRADRALYTAKRRGGNQLCIATEDESLVVGL
ncbi:MAG: sensor domain-containing diguanylate cyclase [Chloroflexi bacterium]|nr:sensor domain-containing diguanylate cyclase [Chloroflexota bacterium]